MPIIGTKYRLFIFVVESNPDCVARLMQGLEVPEQSLIKAFSSGESFIDFFPKSKIPKRKLILIFLGYTFSDEANQNMMNGIEILETVKMLNPAVHVVMLTHNGEQEYGGHAKSMGASSCIMKDESMVIRANSLIRLFLSEKKLGNRRRQLKVAAVSWLVALVCFFLSVGVSCFS